MDFELSLIHRDEINVAYILNLLRTMNKTDPAATQKCQKEILDLMATEVQLRNKRALMETFIENNLQQLQPDENVMNAFEDYWLTQKEKAFIELCTSENIVPEELSKLINNYAFANRLPREQEIVSSLNFKPKILERKKTIQRVSEKIKSFIDTFIEGMGGTV